jgi:hypothetical protein
MQQSAQDPDFYTGTLWLMSSGSWQVRLGIKGVAGPATASVPVVAAPTALLTMQRPLGVILGVLGLILVLGVVGIVAAAVREARLTPGVVPDSNRRRRALIAGVAAFAFSCVAVWLGGKWWNVEAADYASDLYRASDLRTTLTGNQLRLTMGDTVKGQPRDGYRVGEWEPIANDRLLLDHGKPMHLYAIRWPQMDAVYHLHPETSGKIGLTETLPAMPAGTYKLFADIVYLSGLAETMTATLNVPPGISTAPVAVDDASAAPPPLSAAELGTTCKLPDGYTMVWERPAQLTASTAYSLRFTLLAPNGKPALDVVPYLGMAGHAAFVKTDGTTFAHTHPDGSAAMPAMMIANQESSALNGVADNGGTMTSMQDAGPLPASVEFPYGFPSAGRYRVFVQIKHGTTVETGVFDADVR